MTLQQHFAKYISEETEQIEALCALFSERTLKKKEYLLQKRRGFPNLPTIIKLSNEQIDISAN